MVLVERDFAKILKYKLFSSLLLIARILVLTLAISDFQLIFFLYASHNYCASRLLRANNGTDNPEDSTQHVGITFFFYPEQSRLCT